MDEWRQGFFYLGKEMHNLLLLSVDLPVAIVSFLLP